MKMFFKYDYLKIWYEILLIIVYGEFGRIIVILIGFKFFNVSLNKGCGFFDWVFYLCLILWVWG